MEPRDGTSGAVQEVEMLLASVENVVEVVAR
jgi:hypothetical protein